MIRSEDLLEIYTDGSCINHAAVGAWSYIKTSKNEILAEASGYESNVTHIRMELTAVYHAVKDLDVGARATIFTDSKYIVDAINLAKLEKWLKTDFRTKKGTRSHADIWRLLAVELTSRTIQFVHVPAHDGVEMNERADRLARQTARSAAGILTDYAAQS